MESVKDVIKYLLYYFLSFINYIIPKDKNFVFIFDKKAKKDNSYAFADYIVNNSDITVFYFVKDNSSEFLKFNKINNFIVAMWYQFRSNLIVYSYRGDGFLPFKSFRGQSIVDMMHGSPLKSIGYANGRPPRSTIHFPYNKTFDYILCQSEFFEEVIINRFGASKSQCLIMGYPRNDLIYRNKNFFNEMKLENPERSILWMPTWRNAAIGDSGISVEEYDFPILNKENISDLNECLKNQNIILVIKPHPFQVTLEIFKESLSNILMVDNATLLRKNIDIYETLNTFDALITDYSSIFFDYLLLDKPIGFTIDDYDLYKKYHGFSVENPLDIMPGNKIYDYDTLKNFIIVESAHSQTFENERKSVLDLANKYKDGFSSQRILEFFIEK